MSNKDYRELQLSSSQLVIIFLAIIVLGVIIFLLGISVGKKTEIVLASQSGSLKVSEKITEEKTVPIDSPKTKVVEKTTAQQKNESQPKKATPINQPQNLDWFIQVGAFNNRAGAQTTADKLKEGGLNVIVLDPYSSERKRVYRVRIGGYATKELAENTRIELVRTDSKAKNYFVIRQK